MISVSVSGRGSGRGWSRLGSAYVTFWRIHRNFGCFIAISADFELRPRAHVHSVHSIYTRTAGSSFRSSRTTFGASVDFGLISRLFLAPPGRRDGDASAHLRRNLRGAACVFFLFFLFFYFSNFLPNLNCLRACRFEVGHAHACPSPRGYRRGNSWGFDDPAMGITTAGGATFSSRTLTFFLKFQIRRLTVCLQARS